MKVYRKEEEIISLVEEMCDWLIKESEQGRKVSTKNLVMNLVFPKQLFYVGLINILNKYQLKNMKRCTIF